MTRGTTGAGSRALAERDKSRDTRGRLTATVRCALFDAMDRTMTWRNEGRLNVVVHGPKAPSAVEWTRYLNEMAHRKNDELRVVVFSHGGAPDGGQRLQLTSIVEGGDHRMPLALITDALLVRAMVGVLRWFNPAIRAFALSETRVAYDFLGLTADERERVATLHAELERDLGDRPRRADAAPPVG